MVMTTRNKLLMAFLWGMFAFFMYMCMFRAIPNTSASKVEMSITPPVTTVDFSDVYPVQNDRINIGNGILLSREDFKKAVIMGTEVMSKKPELVAKVCNEYNVYTIDDKKEILKKQITLTKPEESVLELYNRYRGQPCVREAIWILFQRQNDGEFMKKIIEKVEVWVKNNK